MGEGLTHTSPSGEARMVDVSGKAPTNRSARAEAFVEMSIETLKTIQSGTHKGDVYSVSRIAGIMAAKKTHELIPLCHPLAITGIDVRLEAEDGGVRIVCEVSTADRTGVEMEALTGASVAALTLYDMCKAVERGITITNIRLLSKSGGRSGEWTRD